MIIGTNIIGASLLALLVDRIILERHLGGTTYSVASTRLSTTFLFAFPVMVVLTLSSTISCLLGSYLLQPVGASYLYPLTFAAAIVATATVIELSLSKWLSPEMRNRISSRTIVMVAILGFLVLIPKIHSPGTDSISPAACTLAAVISGTVFLFISLLWNGIREKIDLADNTNTRLSPAQEIVAAALTALVLFGISGMNLFHSIKAP